MKPDRSPMIERIEDEERERAHDAIVRNAIETGAFVLLFFLLILALRGPW